MYAWNLIIELWIGKGLTAERVYGRQGPVHPLLPEIVVDQSVYVAYHTLYTHTDNQY